MRAAAILLNLMQMVIVLAIFVLQGLSFSGWTILGLFIILIIACFNMLILIFHRLSDQRLVQKDKTTIVKRQDLRVVYGTGRKPDLMIGRQTFPLLDLSESGLRIRINRHENLKKRVRVGIELLCGEIIDARATVVRRQADEAAMQFRSPLGYVLLLKEKQVVSESSA